MNTDLKQWKPGRTLQSTQRADYKPFPEATLQVYQFCSQPRKKPNPPAYATSPPKIDEDTWAKYRKYCYRTTNSIYGSSSFTQKGKSLVVSVLEKDQKESVAPKAKDNQGNLTTQDANPSARPAQAWFQNTTVSPAQESNQRVEASTPSTPQAPTSSSSSPSSSSGNSLTENLSTVSSASTLNANTITSSSAKQCHSSTASAAASPTSSCVKEAWRSDSPAAKETTPVAKEVTKATDKLPQIGSGEGGVGLGQQQEPERTKSMSYEEFLRDMCHSVRLERLLNQRFASQTSATLKGSQSAHTTNYRESFHNIHEEKKSLRAATVKLPKPDIKQRRQLYVLSEYADKFGFLQRAYPPNVCYNTAPVKVVRPQVTIQRTAPPLPRTLLCSEYMASYRHPSTRPKTCW